MGTNEKIKVVLVEDHPLIRKGIGELINKIGDYNVIWDASNGLDFINNIKILQPPQIVLLDIVMPVMDGFETARWINENYPDIKILIISMLDNEETIMEMIQLKVDGYILKESEPEEMKIALDTIMNATNYYTPVVKEIIEKNKKQGN